VTPAPAPAASVRDTVPLVATKAHRTARLLALAHRVERMVQAGELRDYRDAATRFDISHARMSQVTGMLLLAPAIQADILLGRTTATEGGLRRTANAANWSDQHRTVGLGDAVDDARGTSRRREAVPR
jgi:hypothetical protein